MRSNVPGPRRSRSASSRALDSALTGKSYRRGPVRNQPRYAVLVALTLAPAAWASAQPVVPWLNERPAKPFANPPLAPPCQAHDLRASLFLQGATGSLVGGVTFLNAGPAACSLVGRPSFSFSGAAAAAEHWQVEKLASTPTPDDVLPEPPAPLRAPQPAKRPGGQGVWPTRSAPGSGPAR